jgi:hypothetical protein
MRGTAMMTDSVGTSRPIKRTKNKAMDTANSIALKNKDNYLLYFSLPNRG